MLKEKLEKFSRDMASKAPEDVIRVMKQAAQELLKSKIAEKSLKNGDRAPEFSLPNLNGQLISSNELLSKKPLIVNFYRGGWCPYCTLEISEWQKIYPKILEAGADIVSISPNVPKKLSETKTNHSVEFELLSDVGNNVARSFGLVFTLPEELRPIYKQFGINLPEDNGDESYELPIPATYVIKEGIIVYSFVDADYTKRAEPAEVLKMLSSLKGLPYN